MNRKSVLFVTFLAFAAAQNSFAGIPEPVLITWLPEIVFTPTGFDDNDNVQVVLSGNLSTTCHKVAKPEVEVDVRGQRIMIRDQALEYASSWCVQMNVHYTKTVDLGVLPRGNYAVYAVTGDNRLKRMGVLPVSPAKTSSPDEVLYAPVDEVSVQHKDGQLVVTIRGEFPNACMKMSGIRSSRRQSNVIEILPVVEMTNREICPQGKRDPSTIIPFEEVITGTKGDRPVLVHIRSMNGQSLNRVVE